MIKASKKCSNWRFGDNHTWRGW